MYEVGEYFEVKMGVETGMCPVLVAVQCFL